MVVLGKGHCDAQTLVPKPLSESSLPPPRGSRCVSITNRRQHEVSAKATQKTKVTHGPKLVVVVVVVVVLDTT